MNDVAELLQAIASAAEKHRNQRRKDAEASPYINHPIALAHLLDTTGGVSDPVVLQAAILHYEVEDTETTYEELVAEFDTKVADIVMEVTDDKALPKQRRKELQVEHAHKKGGVRPPDKIPAARFPTASKQRLPGHAYRLANASVRWAKLTSAWSLMACVAHAGLLSWWNKFA